MWAQAKQEVASKNTAFISSDAAKVLKEDVDYVTAKYRYGSVEHVKNLKEKPFKRDIDESNVQPVLIALYASGTEGETEV